LLTSMDRRLGSSGEYRGAAKVRTQQGCEQ
jgi:hypothetical protein